MWVYPPLAEAMSKAGLQEIETYFSRHQNTVSQYIATRPIMDMCLVAEQRLGTRVPKRWWEQESLELERIRMAAWTANLENEDMEGEDTGGETYD